MGYTPMLIIDKRGLLKSLPVLEKEEFSKSINKSSVAKFLIACSGYTTHKFGKEELVICTPEFTEKNRAVRKKLDELGIKYSEEA